MPDYKLVYGNKNSQTINFEKHLEGLVLLNRPKESGKVKLLVLDGEYLLSDSLIINSWPSNELWKNVTDFFYRPSILYNNSFCEMDRRETRKEIIVKIALNNYKIDRIDCLPGKEELKKDEIYEFKDMQIIFSQSRKSKHKVSIIKNGQKEIELNAVSLDEEKNNPFIIERIDNGFAVISLKSQEFIVVNEQIKRINFTIDTDLDLSQYRIQLKYDRLLNKYYLLKIPLGQDNDSTLQLFVLKEERFIESERRYKKSYYNKVSGSKLYSVFDVKREDGDFNGIFSTLITE